MGLDADIRAALETGLAPEQLEVINESHQHAGHAGDDGSGESHWRVVLSVPALEGESLNVRRMDRARLTSHVARRIADGQVAGWFRGRMEWGPRALGNRSVLVRPDDPSVNDWLNKRLKRTEFMPFAPAVMARDARDVFCFGP